MTGLYIVADLGALGAAADDVAAASGAGAAPGALPSFGHAGADAAASDFARAAQRHGRDLAEASGRGADVLRGYVVAFREIGD